MHYTITLNNGDISFPVRIACLCLLDSCIPMERCDVSPYRKASSEIEWCHNRCAVKDRGSHSLTDITRIWTMDAKPSGIVY